VFRLTVLLAGALAMLAACGPLPRPFMPDDKSEIENPLLRLPDHGGVVVPPAWGLPEDEGRALSEAVAEALRNMDIPANSRVGNPQSLILDLQTHTRAGRIAIAASLVDPDGTALLEDTKESAVPAAPDDPKAWAAQARALAQAISAAMKPDAIAARLLPSLLVGDVAGAPGDGGRTLARSLAFQLEKAGLRVVDAGGSGVLAVEGFVTIANLPNEMRRVSIQWRVRDAGGTELGRVDMANPVPRALIERQWAELAFEIAAASADGIRDIAERHRVRAP
jgi:hypothetical protein